MPGVFLNLSFTTSPVTSATYSEQGVTVPADRVCEKRHSCSRHILYLPIPQNENEDAIPCPWGIKLFFHSLLLSLSFSVWVAYSPFSSSIYFFLRLSSLVTQIGIPKSELESQINNFDISVDKEAMIIPSTKCPVIYGMKWEQTSIPGWAASICQTWSRNWSGHLKQNGSKRHCSYSELIIEIYYLITFCDVV